jgi:hypothetical protein
MKEYFKILILPAALIVANCNQGEITQPQEQKTSGKAPFSFDESKILVPPSMKSRVPTSGINNAPLAKTASTYYQYGIGWGISQADLDQDCKDGSNCLLYKVNVNGVWKNIITAPYGNFIEATYSDRFSSNPENLWVANGDWEQSGILLDNEQTEQHFLVTDHVWPNDNFSVYEVSMDYDVSSESGYDWLWINSTASNSSCNSPGVVRAKVSGTLTQTGHVYFQIPRSCGTIWVGVYYIKDGSVSSNGDWARIRHLMIQPGYVGG